MENDFSKVKTVRKWFTPAGFEKEEIFLHKMSLSGWHFAKVTRSGLYIFTKGEPKDYWYRLDFRFNNEDMESYRQLFKDASWDYVGSLDGIYNGSWRYFRKEAKNGEKPEIFTDNDSKSELLQRIRKTWCLFGLFIFISGLSTFFPCVVLSRISFDYKLMLGIIYAILYSAIILLYGRMFISLSKKIKKLKNTIYKSPLNK